MQNLETSSVTLKLSIAVAVCEDALTDLRRREEREWRSKRGLSSLLTKKQFAEMNSVVDRIVLDSKESENLANARRLLTQHLSYR
jgi:hypothetical protein